MITKYPSTPYFDAKKHAWLLNQPDLVVTEKMDGENTSMYREHIHARSVDGRNHPSRHWVKQHWASIAHMIPPGWRICGENLYAKHSIAYDRLPSYFLGFSVWDDRNYCLNWDTTLLWFDALSITPVPVLDRGVFVDATSFEPSYSDEMEGYVIRNAKTFPYERFAQNVAKVVRQDHVQETHQVVVPNRLAL